MSDDVIVFCTLSVHPYLQVPEYDVGIIVFKGDNIDMGLKRIKTCKGEAKKDMKEGFKLSELWRCFSEWSAYGVAVPILLDDGGRVIQYYSPSLSALQLYTTEPYKNSSCLGSNATTRDDDDSCHKMTTDQCGYLYYQYNETASPYDRVPFNEKISELSKQYSGLVHLHSKDLSPYMYQVPGATNVKELSACFLTYHPLSSSLSPGSENIMLESEKVDGKRSDMPAREDICLPPFAMISYRMFGTLWISPETSDFDVVLCQRNAASYWLKQVQFHHHDFNFMSRQFQNSDLYPP
ncbi:hypothetical protein GQ457_17G004440 [Hibiscus cannabinus]